MNRIAAYGLLLLTALFSAPSLCAQHSWFHSTITRIELTDTAGMQQELNAQAKKAKTDDSRYLVALAQTHYLLVRGKDSLAEIQLADCRRLDSLLGIDSLKGTLAFLEGTYYYNEENYLIALSFLNQSALHFGNTAKTALQARCFGTRGMIIQALKNNPDEAEKSFGVALAYYEKANIPKRKGAVLNNLALVNIQRRDSARASAYLFRSLAVRDSIGDLVGVGQCYNNLGALMYDFGHYAIAIDYYRKGKEVRAKGNAPQSAMVESDINIGKCLRKMGDPGAGTLLEQALADAKTLDRLELQRRTCYELMNLYFDKRNYERAYAMQSEYYRIEDTLYNQEKKDEMTRLSLQYDFQNERKQDSLQRAERELADAGIREEKEKRTTLVIVALLAGLVLAGIFVYNLYRSNQQKKKSNEIISFQRDSLDKKQQEITESIRYAKYIQEALLPARERLRQHLPEHFILYKPKDIVSGDFYWMNVSSEPGIGSSESGVRSSEKTAVSELRTPDSRLILLAVADCTGHGVPGAFMSLLGKENLDKVSSVSKKPGELLALLNRSVKRALMQEKTGEDEGSVRDGMDIALVRMENAGGNLVVTFAGANRPLWIAGQNGMEEIKATKAAIGGFTADTQVFDETVVRPAKGDTLYLFTDGYADQFGGDKQKKLTTKKFRELLLEIHRQPMPEQEKKLAEFFNGWKDKLEQVDDILVIGIRA